MAGSKKAASQKQSIGKIHGLHVIPCSNLKALSRLAEPALREINQTFEKARGRKQTQPNYLT